jgi:hypothetical protein
LAAPSRERQAGRLTPPPIKSTDREAAVLTEC